MRIINNIGRIRFRAFRAIDDILSCERYLEGHQKVLRIFDIAHITSASAVWMSNPNCYIIIVESLTGDKIYGGARIQVADVDHPLPLEEAIGEMDSKIFNMIKEKSINGCGELCGLWNSREVAGWGIGSIFLGMAGISLANQLKLNTLVALCAPATLAYCLRIGFEIEKTLGNSGSFYYPKLDLVATALTINDTINLPMASDAERKNIFDLRTNPNQIKDETSLRGNISIEYALSLTRSASQGN